MAINPVTLAETLRPWRGAGLFCLLRDTEGLEELVASDFSAHVPEAATSGAWAFSDHRDNLPSVAILEGTSSTPTISVDPIVFSTKNTTTEPMQRAPTQDNKVPLPEVWTRILDKTPKAPVLWTYAALGQDLSGAGDPIRSNCLKSLIGQLSLPKGSSCFWPSSLAVDWANYADKDLSAPDAHCFWAGLKELAPKIVIFIGAKALSLTGVEVGLKITFTQVARQGRVYLLLPDFEDFLGTKSLEERSIAYLQSVFNSYPALFKRKQ